MANLDTPKPLRMEVFLAGMKDWVLVYWYPEHCQFLTCITKDTSRSFVKQEFCYKPLSYSSKRWQCLW